MFNIYGVWNDTRASKLENFHFWVNYPFHFQSVPHKKHLEYSARVKQTLLWSFYGAVLQFWHLAVL